MWTSFWTQVRRETKGILRTGQERLKTESWPCDLAAGFSSHQAVARTAGSIILRLSDSFFLPLKVSDYSETLRSFLQAAQQDLGALLEQHSISLGMHSLTLRHGEPCTPRTKPLLVPHRASGDCSGEI